MSARITDTDRVIIQHLRTNARISNAKLADHARLSESQCLRRLRELERAKIIQQYIAVINLVAVDLPIFGVIEIRLGDPTRTSMEAFERAMAELTSITDCWHTSGDVNYMLAASVSDPPAYERVLNELSAINRVSIVRSGLVLRNVKPTSQAAPSKKSRRPGLGSTGALSRKRLDDFDRRILGILSTDARISNAGLARRIGLSPAPCLRRVQALEKLGIIQNYVALVDSDALNLVIAVVRIQFHYENRQLRWPFEQWLLTIPEIRSAYRTNGESDYLLVFEASSVNNLERLLVESLLSHPGVKGLQSAIRLRNCLRSSRLRGIVLGPGPNNV